MRKIWLIVFVSTGLFVLTVILQAIRHSLWMSRNRYDAIILRASNEYGVDPNLIKAVILQESKFDPITVGTVGEKGLMQVTDAVGLEWAAASGVKHFSPNMLFSPETNVFAGTWYLGKAMNNWKQVDDPAAIGLAEYNAGRKNVLRWIDEKSANDPEHFVAQIGFPSTQQYVRNILQQRRRYANQGEF